MREKRKVRKHGTCRWQGNWRWLWTAGLGVAVSFCTASTAVAVPLANVWSAAYRNNIKVYLCITRFEQQFPHWNKDVLRANVRNVLDTWNAYGGVDLYFSWQGELTCGQPDCLGPGDPVMCRDGALPNRGEVVIRAQFCHSGGALATADTSGSPITKANIGFCRKNDRDCTADDIKWTFDHTTEPWHRIHTILGTGAIYWPATRVAHNGCSSHYGPAAVYGEGRYVIAWTLTNDTRRIAYRTSATGFPADSWSAVQFVQYQGGNNYGSMWEPTLAYNANKGVFLVAWTNWQVTWTNDDALGRVRICLSDDPATQGFGNCSEYYMARNSPPALVCHSTANECILAWTNHIGYYDHHISYRKGYINASGYFELTGFGHYYTSGVSTRLAPDLGYGNSYWMLSFRENDGRGANLRMAEAAWPNWSNKTFPDSPLQASPTIQFGSTWNEFAYDYSKR